MEYRFSLDNSRPVKLFLCPQCRKKTFKRYIDKDTNSYLDEYIGRCNREVNCGYHATPKNNVEVNPFNKQRMSAHFMQSKKQSDYIEQGVFEKTLGHYERNNFYQFLVAHYCNERAAMSAQRFCLGTSKHWAGATIFWQVDIHNRIRAGKIMLYDAQIGRRVKLPFNHITWVHRLLSKNKDYQLNQCLFGEHQLITAPKQLTVGIVESEKTAIIASIVMPELIWLACGSVSNLSIHKFKSIADRKIILYPDLNAFDKWKIKANELSGYNLDIHISDILERAACPNERAGGYDLADYLLK
jgi:hypothetical protein